MANYSTMITLVRDWSNRDSSVVHDDIISRSLTWAADRVYRELRIPPLEYTAEFDIEASDIEQVLYRGLQYLKLPIPENMIEPIYIRKVNDGTTYNSRIDRRTIFDETADRYLDSYTQIGSNYELLGSFQTGQVIEIHYYRRLPALNETYQFLPENFGMDYLRPIAASSGPPPVVSTFATGLTANIQVAGADATDALYFPTGTTEAQIVAYQPAISDIRTSYDGDHTVGMRFTSLEVQHWLRDENERMLIYGALQEVFNYLDEPETMARYAGLFNEEIMKLNQEQMKRMASGGNLRVSYSARGYL